MAVLLVWACLGFSQEKISKSQATSDEAISGLPRYSALTIANMWAWFRSDGLSNHSPQQDNGAYFPKFTGNMIYQDGLVWGAKAFLDPAFTQPAPRQIVRVGGGSYGIGTRAGHVTGSGATAVAADPNSPDVRIYRIRRDYASLMVYGSPTHELLQEAGILNEIPSIYVTPGQAADVYQQYETDWQQWPVQRGAPYIERNGIPGFQPPPPFSPQFTVDSLIAGNYDEPGISGPDTGSPADQVLFMVYNDLSVSQAISFKESEPLGLEIQKTVWGYKGGNPIQDMYFARYRMINRGGVDVDSSAAFQGGSFYLDSMYICQWSDPDLGSFSDDLKGCDPPLNLAFAYNGNSTDATFQNYGLPPPSVGYVLLQGSVVTSASDSAIFAMKVLQGFKNLPMTSFSYFGPGSPYNDPIDEASGYASETGQWWKMLRGFAPLGTINTADIPYAHPPGSPITQFPLSGDPLSGTGFIDGLGTNYSFAPSDARFLLNSGPFQLAPGDTQEVIVATVFGLGSDRLSSVGIMKSNVRFARSVHEGIYSIPRAPEQPNVMITELDGEVILQWGSHQADEIESRVIARQYRFEGYNVYQLPSANAPVSDGTKIATFDHVNSIKEIVSYHIDPLTGTPLPIITQRGNDNGVQRFIKIRENALGGFRERLNNGQSYHFAVSSYNYADSPVLLYRSFESLPARVTAIPRIPFGLVATSTSGDTVSVSRLSGSSDGTVLPIVVDPFATTGDTYDVRFHQVSGTTVWDLTNVTRGSTVLSGQTHQARDGAFGIAEGLQVRVLEAPSEFRNFLVVANALGPLSPPEYGSFAFNNSGFPSPTTGDRPDGLRQQSSGLSSTQGWGIQVTQEGSTFMDYDLFLTRISQNGSTWASLLNRDFEIRFTAAGGKGGDVSSGTPTVDVPFELWNIGKTPNDPSDDYRMLPFVLDFNVNNTFDLLSQDHSISASTDDPQTETFSWHEPLDKTPGQAGYNAWVSGATAGTEILSGVVLVLWNGGTVSDPSFPANVAQLMPETGTVFRLESMRTNDSTDVFSFTAPSVQSGLSVQKASVRRVGVFPNPYYAYRNQETTPWRNYVTFNNLPPKAIIRIFNLAGHLVKILEKNHPSQFFEWDLTNKDNWQVASGVYICYVEMPDIGETKVLKLAVIQPQIIRSY